MGPDLIVPGEDGVGCLGACLRRATSLYQSLSNQALGWPCEGERAQRNSLNFSVIKSPESSKMNQLCTKPLFASN